MTELLALSISVAILGGIWAFIVEAHKYSALAIDTLVELTKDNHTDSTRYSAATVLLDRGLAVQRNLSICIFRPMRLPNGSAT